MENWNRIVRDNVNSEASSQACSHRFSRSTRRTSQSWTHWRSASTGFDAISNCSVSKSRPDVPVRSQTSRRNSSYIGHSSKAKLNVQRSIARDVHRGYFEPTHAEFAPRTMWSLSNALTSALSRPSRFHSFRRPRSSERSSTPPISWPSPTEFLGGSA